MLCNEEDVVKEEPSDDENLQTLDLDAPLISKPYSHTELLDKALMVHDENKKISDR